MKRDFPIFDIDGLVSNKLPEGALVADRFQPYYRNNPHVQPVHKHTFYHIVFFTAGQGTHTLDFEKYPVRKGVIYFMRPNQVHNWSFDTEAEGYVVNFTDALFDFLHLDTGILRQFPFFNYFNARQVFEIEPGQQHILTDLFEKIIDEVTAGRRHNVLAVWCLMIQLFITVSRTYEGVPSQLPALNNYTETIAKKFIQLIESHYKELKLPKEYATMLHISSGYLNDICNEVFHTTAGSLIRDRVLLEAKRLLVNRDMTINAIAAALHFLDTAYFVRFFKKNTGFTPESFRKQCS